jgi:hypothetical protein
MRYLALVLMLSACATAFGGEAGIAVDTHGRFRVGARAIVRSGWWTDRGNNNEDVYSILPELIVGAAWEVTTRSLRGELGGLPALGWARYEAGRWSPSAELLLPHVSARIERWRLRDLRVCSGLGARYAKDTGDTQGATFKHSFHSVGAAGEGDLCWGTTDGMFGDVFAGGGYEYVLMQ